MQPMYADEAEWERRRERITDLYFNQDKTLREVAAIMRDHHSFVAT